jgi:hypothetical protein
MSWNISTRLNNLQQQVNNIANTGLTNPMEQILNANNFAMQNLTILNGNSNVLQLASNNVGGIQTNCSVTVSGDLTCNTLNYTELNPPLAPNNINFNVLNSGTTQNTSTSYTSVPTSPYTGIVTKESVLNPSASGTITMSSPNSSNSVAIGFSTVSSYPTGGYLGVQSGLLFYSGINSIASIINGNLSDYTPYATQTIDFQLKCVNGTLKVYINGVENVGFEQPLPSGNYYFTIGTFTFASNCLMTNINVNQSTSETLDQVLTNGNSAGGLDIEDVGTLTCNTLNYTTLNPPITGGGETLQQTLTNGNSAGGLDIDDVGALNADSINSTGSIYAEGYLQAGNKAGLSAIQLLYGNGTTLGNNYQIIGVNDTFQLQQYKNNALTAQPLLINQETLTQFKTSNLVYTQDGTNNYYILDSNFNTPCYKQIFTNLNQTVSNMGANASPFFSVPIYTKSNSYNYGVNYTEILFSSLNLTFTSSTVFGSNLQATIFLSSANSGEFNPALGNSIVINITNTNGTPTYTFNSSIPIILYFNNTTQFNKLYLLVAYSIVTLTNYNLQITNSNMAVTGYISSNPNGSITWGS